MNTTHPTRSRARRVLLALCAALPLWATAQAPEPVKLGVIGPFSGPSSDFGTPMLQGIKLAVDEINAVGGYLGRPLELVVRDDQGTPDVGLKASQELVAAGVLGTVGFCNTGVALKSIDVFQNAKVPLIVPCSTGTPVTSKYPMAESYIFRNSARDSIQAPFVVADLVKRGWTKVAVFADTTGYGEAGLQDVQAALAAHKLQAVNVTRFPLGVTDLREELKVARDAGANVVFSYTVGPENAAIALGRRDIGWKVPQVGAWPLSFPFFIDVAKEAGEGALMAQTFIAEPSNERRAAFLSAYTRKWGKKLVVPMAAAQGYDAVYLFTYALLGIRDGKLSGPAMKTALENIQRVYYGVVATYEHPFSDKDKDAITANMLVMGKVQAGGVTFAYPEDARRNLIVQRKK
ncbi:MAG: ABC transporter substrate-binding protein [Simplicispira sp.]|nr:ABC transporter substrate-binding protein [Simplicispira sp.]